ncbi:unnamed protein product [Dibothriocephalus latus]|uniref:Uncharacterized protein n=1 Tax=Dibothriocephalus latus TaxID=60516 RepID=A0A3P7P4V4_DIBLA|nr:unnamed protein product [Dibothriocephalus latus]
MNKMSVLELDDCSHLQDLPPDLWRLGKLKSLTFFGTPAYDHLSRMLVGGPSTPTAQHKDTNPGDRILNTATVLAYLRALPRCSFESSLGSCVDKIKMTQVSQYRFVINCKYSSEIATVPRCQIHVI